MSWSNQPLNTLTTIWHGAFSAQRIVALSGCFVCATVATCAVVALVVVRWLSHTVIVGIFTVESGPMSEKKRGREAPTLEYKILVGATLASTPMLTSGHNWLADMLTKAIDARLRHRDYII